MENVERRMPREWPRLRRCLGEAISQVFELGYCTSITEWDRDLGIIAAPILVEGHAPLVIACVGAAGQFTRARAARTGAAPAGGCCRHPAGGVGDFMTATVQPRDGSTILTVTRGMSVLRAFRSDRAPVSNAELVRRTGLSKATVSRLTSTLLQLGFLRHVPEGREFELATGGLGVGHALVASSELVRIAEPVLQDLADGLGVSVALAVPDDLDMLYVAYRASRRVATLRLGTGSVLPMGTTSIGHAYLWGLPARQRTRLVARLKDAAGTQGRAVARGIEASFAELEASGVCSVLGGFQRDAFGIATPVHIGAGRVVMGLSCGRADMQPELAAERRRIAPDLKAAAARLEQLLAHVDGQP